MQLGGVGVSQVSRAKEPMPVLWVPFCVYVNGNTANKIGTFTLAIIAKEIGVEFFVASHSTTLDVKLESGDQIKIEERPTGEMIRSSGAPNDMSC